MTDFTEEKIKEFKEKFDTEVIKYDKDSPIIQFLSQAILEAREEERKKVKKFIHFDDGEFYLDEEEAYKYLSQKLLKK